MGDAGAEDRANDYGSVMMEENVVSAAGTSFRLTVDEIKKAITELGYEARERDNWYQLLG
jgi:cyclic dehypoxanthinyl futalosine synthase